MIKEIYEQLKKQEEFSELISKDNHKLAYFFTMIQNGMDVMNGIKEHKFQDINIVQEWQVGIVDSTDDKIIPCIFNVFEEEGEIKTSEIKIEKAAEAFKKPDKKIEEFNLTNFEFKFEDALKKCFEVQAKKYPSHYPMRIIVLLQKIDGKQMWNITFLSMSFETLNIRIDSKTGIVVSDKVSSLISNEKEVEKLKERIEEKKEKKEEKKE